jgi:hypothetical protein
VTLDAPQGRDRVGQGQRTLVSSRDDADRERPRKVELRVIESDGDVLRGIVGAVDAVGDVGDLCDCLKPMGTAARNEDRNLRLTGQVESLPVSVRRGVRPKVDDDVEDGSERATHQFRLSLTRSDVKTAQDSFDGAGDAVLDEYIGIDARLARHGGIEGPTEEAAFVRGGNGFEQEGAFDARDFVHLHEDAPPRLVQT